MLEIDRNPQLEEEIHVKLSCDYKPKKLHSHPLACRGST